MRRTLSPIIKEWGADKPRQYILEMGKINCETDSFELLENSILEKWNSSLKNIVLLEFLTIQTNNSDTVPFINNNDSDAPPQQDGVYSIKIRHVVMTGDIAFYSYCLGKVNMAGSWCWLCRLARSQWQAPEKDREDAAEEDAALWTISWLRRHGKLIEDGVISSNDARVKRGVTGQPAIDALETMQFIVPPLHIELGLINHALKKGFMTWVDRRLENLSEEHELSRSSFIVAELKLENAEEKFGDLISSISESKDEKSRLTDRLKERDNNNQLVLRIHSQERSNVKDLVDQLKMQLVS